MIHIGDVAVHNGEPPDGNPYKGRSLMGPERAAALDAWRDPLGNNAVWDEGGVRHIVPLTAYTFWYAPSFGGARRMERSERENVR